MSALDEAITKFLGITAKLTQKLADATPDAIQLVLQTYRFKGIGELVVGFVLLIAATILAVNAQRKFRLAREIRQEAGDRWRHDEDAVVAGFSIVFAIVAVALGAIAASRLFDIWAWAAAIDPRLYLAHTLLEHLK